MPGRILLLDQPTKSGIALHARTSRGVGADLPVLQDGKAHEQCTQAVAQQGMQVLGQRGACRVLLHPLDGLVHDSEIRCGQG